MPDYFRKRLGMFGEAPQAKKLVSQRTVGPNYFGGYEPKRAQGMGLPMGGANMTPQAAPRAEEMAPGAAPSREPFDWNRMAYVLGGIGKAAMGPFQDRWQAQLGGQVQKLSQAQAYQKATARALSGRPLDPGEFTILTPEQRQEINVLQTENEKLQLAREDAWFKREMALRKQGMDEGWIAEAKKEFWAQHGLEERKQEFKEKEAPIEHKRELEKIEARAEPYRERTRAMLKDVPEGDRKQHEGVFQNIEDEAKWQFEQTFPDEDVAAEHMQEYNSVFIKLLNTAVKQGRLPKNWVFTNMGFMYSELLGHEPPGPAYSQPDFSYDPDYWKNVEE